MIRQTALFIVAAWMFATAAIAGEPVSTGYFSSIAIGGKDAVSYHADAVKKAHRVSEGNKTYSVKYLGANWLFASKESADKFAASPAAYAPQYNGHCANALSTNEGLITTDGSVWEFFGDKLYLFYAERGRQRWMSGDWKSYKQEADAAWKTILAKTP